MSHKIIEIKAKSSRNENIRKILLEEEAKYIGKDHQIDTYFKVNEGRLKLRKGDIENYLIFYERDNNYGPKQSNIILVKEPDKNLEAILNKLFNRLVVVDKEREIYWIGNIKFHLDNVNRLGHFVEIEAQDKEGIIDNKILKSQCEEYMKKFGIKEEDLIYCSYSDLLLATGGLK